MEAPGSLLLPFLIPFALAMLMPGWRMLAVYGVIGGVMLLVQVDGLLHPGGNPAIGDATGLAAAGATGLGFVLGIAGKTLILIRRSRRSLPARDAGST
jgi:hypothetical protein